MDSTIKLSTVASARVTVIVSPKSMSLSPEIDSDSHTGFFLLSGRPEQKDGFIHSSRFLLFSLLIRLFILYQESVI